MLAWLVMLVVFVMCVIVDDNDIPDIASVNVIGKCHVLAVFAACDDNVVFAFIVVVGGVNVIDAT